MTFPSIITILLDVTLKSTLIVAVAILATALLRRRSAALRHLLWCSTLLALIALPACCFLLPQWRLSLLPPKPQTAAAPVTPAIKFVGPASADPVIQRPADNPVRFESEPITRPAEANPAADFPPIQKPLRVSVPPWFHSPQTWLTLLWLIGAGFWMSRWLIGRLILSRWLRKSHAPAPWCLQMLEEAQRQLNLTRRVRLRLCPQVQTPLTFGLLPPIILLPNQSQDWSAQRAQAVLLHELAHIQRRDWLTQLLGHIAVSLHWFNPLVWYAARQLRLESEKACDDRVLGNLSRPSDYAQHLLDIARTLTRSSPAALPMARPGQLETRIDSILDATRNRHPATRRAVALAAIAAAMLLLPLASIHLARALAAEAKKLPPQQAVVLNPDLGWRYSGWAGQSDTQRATMRVHDDSVLFSVYEPGKRKVWTKYPAWPIDWKRFPLVTLKYRATATNPTVGQYLLWLDDGTGPNGGNGKVIFYLKDALPDGRPHEMRADLSQMNLKGDGTIVGLALGVQAADKTPATLELLGLSFQSNEPRASATGPSSLPTDPPLTIQVTDAQSAQPLPGVTVTIDADRLNYARSAVTDAQGKATVTPLASPDRKHMLRAEKQGMATVEIPDTSKAKPPVQLHLARLIQNAGQVVNEQQQPVAGAWLRLNFSHGAPGEGRTDLPENTVTDKAGRWSAMLPADLRNLSLRITHPDYLTNTGPYTTNPTFDQMRHGSAVSVLHKGIPVSGTVYDADGKSVPNARITTGKDRSYEDDQTTLTDAAGHFSFANLPPGPLVLTATAAGSGPALLTTTAEKGMKPIDIHLTSPQLFKARVVDIHGQPVTGVSLYAESWRGMRTLNWSGGTDKDGQVTWTDAPPDEVKFSTYKEGYGQLRDYALSADNGKEHQITLRPPLTIHGTITDAVTGKPIMNCTVIPGFPAQSGRTSAYWERSNAKAVEDGTYSFQFPYPRTDSGHLLRIEADNYIPVVYSLFKDGQGDQTFNFKLQPGKSITGVVRNAAGQPVAGATIYLLPPSTVGEFYIGNGRIQYTRGQPSFVSAKDGSFTFPPQDGDYYLVTLGDHGFAQITSKEFEASHELKLQQWGRVTGTAMIGDKPAANRSIGLFHRNHPMPKPEQRRSLQEIDNHQTTTDASGRFTFDRVEPGEVGVGRMIMGQTWSTTTGPYAHVDVKPGQTATVTIGGKGRPVIGKIQVPPQLKGKINLDRLSGRFMTQTSPLRPPLPPGWEKMSLEAKKQWRTRFENSPEGHQFAQKIREQQDGLQSYGFVINPDGSFRMEDVVPGTYVGNGIIYGPSNAQGDFGRPIARLNATVTIPPIPTGRSDQPLDMGVITVTPIPTSQPSTP
jgi:beta-lactamase regulating signal transducer with metallopeptidase domain